MNDFNTILANTLKDLRITKHAKQEVLAQELGISQQAYSKLEAGKVNFTPNMINKLCAYFNSTVAEFLNTGQSIKIIDSPQANSTIGTCLYNVLPLYNSC